MVRLKAICKTQENSLIHFIFEKLYYTFLNLTHTSMWIPKNLILYAFR